MVVRGGGDGDGGVVVWWCGGGGGSKTRFYAGINLIDNFVLAHGVLHIHSSSSPGCRYIASICK